MPNKPNPQDIEWSPVSPEQAKSESGEPGLVRRGLNWITGAGRKEPGVGEFSSGFDLPNPLKTAAGALFSTDEKQILGVLQQQIPDAEFAKDKFGNLMVRIPSRGQWEYLNEPGISPRDVKNAIAQLGAFIAGGKGVASLLGRLGLTSLPMRFLGQGAGAAGASAALDVGSSAMGSKEGIDVPKAAVVGAMGAAGEMFAPAFNKIYGALRSRRVTPAEARQMLTDAGYSVDDITDDVIERMIDIARRAASPEEAARVATAQGLPVPVPLTRGQVTMSPKDQMFEDLAYKGAYGEGPSTIMRGVAARQEEALRANIPEIQRRIGGGVIERPGDAGRIVQNRLLEKRSDMGEIVDSAYRSAREAGGTIGKDLSESIFERVRDAAGDMLRHAPGANDKLELLRGILTRGKEMGEAISRKELIIYGPDGMPLMTPKDTAIRALYDWRREATRFAQNAPNKTEAAATRSMIKELDNALDDAILADLAAGEAASINAWKAAVRARREFGQAFESKDLVQKLVDTKNGELRVAPEAASNVIFGVSDTNLLSRPELARELRKIKRLVTPDAWDALREEAFLRIAARGEAGQFAGGQRMFSGVNMKKAWEQMRAKNPEVLHILFEPEEQALISRFVAVAAQVTNPVKGGANFSNTAVGLSNIVQKLSEGVLTGEKGRMLIGWMVRALQGSTSAAVRGRPTPFMLPAGTIPGAAAGAGYGAAQ